MVAWVIYFREAALYNQSYIQFYIDEGLKLGVKVKLIMVEDLEFGVKNGQYFLSYQNKVIPNPDFVISRAIYPLLNKHLEYMGIRVFNNSFVSEICNDKAKTYQYLVKTGIKMVDSSFYRNSQIHEIITKVEQPTVIKAVDGHGGKQVFLVETSENFLVSNINNITDHKEELNEMQSKKKDILMGLESSDVVVQPLTGSRYQDVRVYVIGKEIVAAVLRTAKDSFKSNYSLGGEVSQYQLSKIEEAIVTLIIAQFDFGLVGIDFIIGDEGELIFNEIEDVVGSRMLYQCSNINIVEEYLKFIINTF